MKRVPTFERLTAGVAADVTILPTRIAPCPVAGVDGDHEDPR